MKKNMKKSEYMNFIPELSLQNEKNNLQKEIFCFKNKAKLSLAYSFQGYEQKEKNERKWKESEWKIFICLPFAS